MNLINRLLSLTDKQMKRSFDDQPLVQKVRIQVIFQRLKNVPQFIIEGLKGVKWELGLAGFCPGKMGFKPLRVRFSDWEWEKNVKNQKREWDWRTEKWVPEKKNGLGNGIGTPPPPLLDPLNFIYFILFYFCHFTIIYIHL